MGIFAVVMLDAIITQYLSLGVFNMLKYLRISYPVIVFEGKRNFTRNME